MWDKAQGKTSLALALAGAWGLLSICSSNQDPHLPPTTTTNTATATAAAAATTSS